MQKYPECIRATAVSSALWRHSQYTVHYSSNFESVMLWGSLILLFSNLSFPLIFPSFYPLLPSLLSISTLLFLCPLLLSTCVCAYIFVFRSISSYLLSSPLIPSHLKFFCPVLRFTFFCSILSFHSFANSRFPLVPFFILTSAPFSLFHLFPLFSYYFSASFFHPVPSFCSNLSFFPSLFCLVSVSPLIPHFLPFPIFFSSPLFSCLLVILFLLHFAIPLYFHTCSSLIFTIPCFIPFSLFFYSPLFLLLFLHCSLFLPCSFLSFFIILSSHSFSTRLLLLFPQTPPPAQASRQQRMVQ